MPRQGRSTPAPRRLPPRPHLFPFSFHLPPLTQSPPLYSHDLPSSHPFPSATRHQGDHRSQPRTRRRERMLPGVELARRRRVHYHGDVATSAGAGEHHAHYHAHAHAHAHHHAGAAGGVAGPALAARMRLEEKLRGAAPPSPSRWSRLMGERNGRASSRHRSRQEQQQGQEQEILAAGVDLWPPSANSATLVVPAASAGRRAELQRTLSKVDLCAVCLDEVRERHQQVTRLPCSHKYHSECVLPWLAIQPDCPCCRALVPSVDTLS